MTRLRGAGMDEESILPKVVFIYREIHISNSLLVPSNIAKEERS